MRSRNACILHEAREAAGERRLGYKVGATSKPGRRSFGLDEPVYAGMFACNQAADLAEALQRLLLAPSLECEIALRSPVPPDALLLQ